MSDKLSRRGFLGGAIGATVVSACAPNLAKEKGKTPHSPETELVQLRTKVNGAEVATKVHHDDTAIELIRERLNLTGAKIGCGHGACGACAILVDGQPVAACLLPATALEGKSVSTIESMSKPLHPLQLAFMDKDALQCGFCTPGFIVEGIAFYKEWRSTKGDTRPSRDEVAAALAGHLCRCGAYPAIYEAVQDACEGLYESNREATLAKKSPNNDIRVDAKEKVTGAAKYTVDVHYQGQLEGRILRSPYARAKVKKIDWSEALKIPGVKGVVRMLAESGNIRYTGQEIVAVAAIDRKVADEAVKAIKVEYEVKTPLLDSKKARQKEAEPVYLARAEKKQLPNANEGPLFPEPWEENNLRGPLKLLSYKDRAARKAIEEAKTKGHLAQGVFITQQHSHTSLEPHATVAVWESKKKLTVHMSTQSVKRVAEDIAERFELEQEDVTLLAPYVGGGFGAKTTIGQEALAAIELARLTNAPVRVVLDRGEEILVGGTRPESEVNISVATDEKGEATGISAITYSNAGVAVGTQVGALFRLIYPKIPKELVDYDVVTNAPPGLPFRAPGGPPAAFALEQCIDELAKKCNEDPIKLRRSWDPNPNRNKLYDWIETIPEWKDRATTPDKGRYRKAVGFASASWFCFVQPDSQLQLDAAPSGFTARTATQDTGNGSRTTIAISIANTLGVEPKDINVKIADSRYVEGPMTAGSRTTGSITPVAVDAAKRMIDELVEFAEDRLNLVEPTWENGGIRHSKGFLPWKELLKSVSHISVIGKRKKDEGGYVMPFKLDIADTSLHSALSSGVQLSEILIDTRLGKIQVTKVWGGYAVGKIVVPKLARSQIRGGIIQSMGQALYEERRIDKNKGYHLTHGLEDYRIPGIGDIPEIDIHFYEEGFEKVTGGSVGLGELVMLAGPASIANAVTQATGWRPRQLPLRPERILEGINSVK
jgi:xanthine dehydrogenase YagR molybdenum-binding subunit